MSRLDQFEVTPAEILNTYTGINGITPFTGNSVEMLERMGIFPLNKDRNTRENFSHENPLFSAVHLISSMVFWAGTFALDNGRQPQLRGNHGPMADLLSVVMRRTPSESSPYVHANAGLGRLVYCLNGGARTQNLALPKQVASALETLDDASSPQLLREKSEDVAALFGLSGLYLNRHTTTSRRGLCIPIPSLLSESDVDMRANALVRCFNLVDQVDVLIEKDSVSKEGVTRYIRRLKLRGVSPETVEEWRSLVGGIVNQTVDSLRH